MDIPVHIENRNAMVTVVAFSGLAPKNHMFEWLKTFSHLPVNLIGIRDPADDWYTSRGGDIQTALLRAFLDVSRPRGHSLFIGASAGGYAALKFGTALCADRILAFSPQSACGEAKRRLNDYRWPEFCQNVHGWHDLSERAHLRAEVHWASDDGLDEMHVIRLACGHKQRHHVGGHDLAHRLKETGELQRIVTAAVAALSTGIAA